MADGCPSRSDDTEGAHLLHHDNTFGTPEEDAFRRDFTINALFYDIATFSVIDYVGGLDDLRAGVVRMIGDPEVRLREDPVRMLRAVALASRLDFSIDPPVVDAIHTLRHDIAKSHRRGCSRRTRSSAPLRGKDVWRLASVGLIEPTRTSSIAEPPNLWRFLPRSMRIADGCIHSGHATNPILPGTLSPLGVSSALESRKH